MGDELKTLYASMNDKIEEGIAKNIETQKMMIYQSRLAAMGEMISMIAHQWRQPLSTIAVLANNMYLDVELETLNEERLKSALLNTIEVTQELSKTIDDFRNFFKPDNVLVEVNIEEVIQDALLVMGKSIDYGDITIVHSHEGDGRFMTYKRELVQVIVNILKNAKDAFERHSAEHQKIMIRSVQDGSNIVLSICDNAGGIEEEIIGKIFEPYFSTKHERNGTGLGLYISEMIVEKHLKGSLRAYNMDNGACFEIIFPTQIS
jgi:C4-dicarboxylate-specific signal transduction histidine kinase